VRALCALNSVFSASVDDSLNVVGKTNRSASQSQQRVDKLALETQRLLEQGEVDISVQFYALV
jgi:hypothetical protein